MAVGALWEEIHQKYLHTIGNLTITGYNSEPGDLPFLEKRNRFFSSPLSLNHRLANLDHWDVEEIKKRASDLTNVAIQIWPFPNLASSTLEKYKGETVESSRDYTEEDHLRNGEDNTRRLYMILKDKVLQLGDSIAVNPVSHYIGFERNRIFMKIKIRKAYLLIDLAAYEGFNDPKGITVQVRRLGGRVKRVRVANEAIFDYLMSLIK